MSKRVNIAVAFPHKGDHFLGVSLGNGVNLGSEPMPCVAGKNKLTFSGGNAEPTCFVENVSGVEEHEEAPQGYLCIDPA